MGALADRTRRGSVGTAVAPGGEGMTAKDMPHVGKAAGGRGRRAARRKPPGGSGGPPYTRSWLYPKQREAIFCKQRYAIVEASTKSGKTVGCMVWLLDQAWPERSRNVPKAATSTGARREEEAPGQPPAPVRNYWWVAPVTAQAQASKGPRAWAL